MIGPVDLGRIGLSAPRNLTDFILSVQWPIYLSLVLIIWGLSIQIDMYM